jgi:hypothetical protein
VDVKLLTTSIRSPAGFAGKAARGTSLELQILPRWGVGGRSGELGSRKITELKIFAKLEDEFFT